MTCSQERKSGETLSKLSVRIVPKGIYNNYNKCFKVSTGKDEYNGKKINNWGY